MLSKKIYVKFIVLLISLLPISEAYTTSGVAFGIFGAPASGKSFMQKKIQEKKALFKKIQETLEEKKETKEDLTIDTIRKNLSTMNDLQKINLVINTFYWLKTLKNTLHQTYNRWWEEFTTRQFDIWSNALAHFENVTFKIDQLKETLILKIDDQTFNNPAHFLQILVKKFKTKLHKLPTYIKNKYQAFMYPIRYLQYQKLFHSVQRKKALYFEETGADFATTKDRLKQLHNEEYLVILFLVQPPHIGINFMQNIFRVIQGFDGARDSGSSIVWTYLRLEESIELYKNMTKNKTMFTITNQDDIFDKKIVSTINKAHTTTDVNITIDVLLQVSLSNLTDVYNRIQNQLEEMFKQDFKNTSIKENIYKKSFKLLLQLQLTTYLDHASNWSLNFITEEEQLKKTKLRLKNDAQDIRDVADYTPMEKPVNYFIQEMLETVNLIKTASCLIKADLPVLKKLLTITEKLQSNFNKFTHQTTKK